MDVKDIEDVILKNDSKDEILEQMEILIIFKSSFAKHKALLKLKDCLYR